MGSRYIFVLLLLLFFPIALSAQVNDRSVNNLIQDNFNRGTWGAQKDIDGNMVEWSEVLEGINHGSFDNEYYFFDAGNVWAFPQGGSGLFNPPPPQVEYDPDEPIASRLCLPRLDLTPPYPEGCPTSSGMNLYGVYVCYEPFYPDYRFCIALDLPQSSNNFISEDYQNLYNDLNPGGFKFTPVAFDADGNGHPQYIQHETATNLPVPWDTAYRYIFDNSNTNMYREPIFSSSLKM